MTQRIFNVFLLSGVIIACALSSSLNFISRFKRIAERNCKNSTDNLPYVIKIFENKGKGEHFLCSGVLVHPSFVVTAAHCVTELPLETLLARPDTPITDLESRAVIEIYSPRDFGDNFKDLDLVLLRLNASFAMDSEYLQPIDLTDSVLQSGERVEVSGWGRRGANATVLSSRRCARIYAGHVIITRNMFCGVVDGRTKVCTADSGGPVVCDGKLCGIVLWSAGWINSQFPEVYLSLRPVRRFIDYIINEHK